MSFELAKVIKIVHFQYSISEYYFNIIFDMTKRTASKIEVMETSDRGSRKERVKRNAMLWLLVLCSSLLLSIPFLFPHMGLVSLIGFVPLFAAEHIAGSCGKKYFGVYYYISFLLWNLFTTYWIYNATLPGMIAAVLLNALQMAIIFRMFRWMKTLAKGYLPYMFFTVAWLAWEHIYFTWDVSWPWLVLGNSFATSIKTIQWYEYTGALGGSLWILLVNTLIFRCMLLVISKRRYLLSLSSVFLLIIIPIIVSHIIFFTYQEQHYEPSVGDGSREFTVLQPNIDPYTDKFRGLTQNQQNTILLQLAEKADASGRFVIAPETFVSRPPLIPEDMPESNLYFQKLYNYARSENVNFIFGAVTEKIYAGKRGLYGVAKENPPTETARYVEDMDIWFDRSNTAVFIDGKGNYEFYNKSKLVVLVESTPYKKLFKFMSRFAIDLGGAMGSYAPQKEREVFVTPDSVKIGTAICYESVYGNYYREYILKGAHVMSIITNDGWWGDTPGYHQHLSYASLRAIETRRSIARSANTGISALINQRGEILEQTEWWKPAYINGSLNLNNRQTVFVKYGDITGRIAKFLFYLFVLMAISRFISKKYIVKEPFAG